MSSLQTSPACLPASRITKAEINELPLYAYEGTVHLVKSAEGVAASLEALEGTAVVGFDTESRPTFKKGDSFPPTVVQVASDQAVYVYQLLHIGGLAALLPLLEDPAVAKVGVALHDDIKRLQELEDFEAAGFVDIASVTRQLGILNTGLRSLTALTLGVRISKSAQLSNWARPELTAKQVSYAATDAWVSREVYLRACEWEAAGLSAVEPPVKAS